MVVLCAGGDQERKFEMERNRMVETQIVQRGVRDEQVLTALRKVPRHEFVPVGVRDQSYTDGPLPIGENQTISQPYIVGLMTELLDLNPPDTVLEIGTGSGYQAAVLAELCQSVFSIEILKPLHLEAKTLLTRLGYKNIYLKYGDGFQGWPEHAPYQGIIVTCAPEKVPQPLLDQLAEGGRLVIPEGRYWQELKVYTKTKGKIAVKDIIPVRFVPMTGKAQQQP